MDFDVDQRDRYGRTALMWAAEMNHKDAVETLIDLGSNRKLVDPQGGRCDTPLAFAQWPILQLFRQRCKWLFSNCREALPHPVTNI